MNYSKKFKSIILSSIVTIFFLRNNIYSLTWPIPENFPGRESITGTFGEYRDATRTHEGIDIGVSYQPIIAPESGEITAKGEQSGGAGYWLEINHYYKFYHLFNDKYYEDAYVGMPVIEGQRIATSGESGSAKGRPHLHFGMGDENPLLYFDISDTKDGLIVKVYFRHDGQLLELTDGMVFNKSNLFPASGEFIVNAYDKSNVGNKVNFYKITCILNGKELKTWEFNVSHSNEASEVYSIDNPASSRDDYYYRMGTWRSAEGKHTLEIRGYDLNNTSLRLSATKTINFIIDTTPPEIKLHHPPKVIFVSKSQWPAGGYKSPISYPVKISFDVEDNIAVDDVYLYVDGRFVSSWENLETDIFLSTTTICGWEKHSLKIIAIDLAGNITDYV